MNGISTESGSGGEEGEEAEVQRARDTFVEIQRARVIDIVDAHNT